MRPVRGNNSRERLRCVSLFSGCGGLDLGFGQGGFRIEFAADNDPIAVMNHERNLGTPVAQMDLRTMLPQVPSGIDVLVAGPPCQGFSTLGARDPDDPRNELLTVPAQAARRFRPRFFLLENVPGLRSGAHAERLKHSAEELKSLGYKVMTIDVEMHKFGVPQRRRRILQLGWLGPGEFRLDLRESCPTDLAAALVDLDDAPNHAPVSLSRDSKAGRIVRRIRQGQKLCNVRSGEASVHTWNIPDVFGSVSDAETRVLESLLRLRRRDRKRTWGDADPVAARTLSREVGFPTHRHLRRLLGGGYVRRIDGRAWDLTHTFNGKYRRPVLSGLSPAVDTRFGEVHYVIHPTENRAFTVREAARIQGFPDSFRFYGSSRDQHRMVANAVPPPMARAVAEAVRGFLAAS
jgi:DNA (cytosine-5)-methyltransferase 1